MSETKKVDEQTSSLNKESAPTFAAATATAGPSIEELIEKAISKYAESKSKKEPVEPEKIVEPKKKAGKKRSAEEGMGSGSLGGGPSKSSQKKALGQIAKSFSALSQKINKAYENA